MKKCSVCGEEYEDDKDYCDNCGIKLDVVESEGEEERELEEEEPEVEEEPEKEPKVEEVEIEAEEVEEEAGPEEEEIRCPNCGNMNPAGAKFCMGCGETIEAPEEVEEEAVEEVSEEEEKEEKELTLLLPGEKEIDFTGDQLSIGREDFKGLLSDEKLRYISRRDNPNKPESKQFEIFLEDGDYYIIDEHSANDTWLGDEKIQNQGEKKLQDGDEIKAAGEIPITVKIG